MSKQGTNSHLVVLSSLPELLFHRSQHAGSLEAERDVLQGLFQRIGEFHSHRHFFTSYHLTLGLQDKERTTLHKLIMIKCLTVKSVGLNTQYLQGRRGGGRDHTAKHQKAEKA